MVPLGPSMHGIATRKYTLFITALLMNPLLTLTKLLHT